MQQASRLFESSATTSLSACTAPNQYQTPSTTKHTNSATTALFTTAGRNQPITVSEDAMNKAAKILNSKPIATSTSMSNVATSSDASQVSQKRFLLSRFFSI